MPLCPCNSGKDFASCCELYLLAKKIAPNPEALMRSRYTAYTLAQIDYIKKTMSGKAAIGFNEKSAKKWAQSVKWLGLRVINSSECDPFTQIGFVEFIATYSGEGQIQQLHENSEFHLINGKWFYVEGKILS